jgi:hypothetical protein
MPAAPFLQDKFGARILMSAPTGTCRSAELTETE